MGGRGAGDNRMGRVTITAASNNPLSTNYKALPGGNTRNNQAARLSVICTGDPGSSAFNLYAALIDDKRVFCVRDIACTKVASILELGASGDYVCDVDVAGSGKDVLDLLGGGGSVSLDVSIAGGETSGNLRWVIGCSGAALPNTGTTTAVKVTVLGVTDKV